MVEASSAAALGALKHRRRGRWKRYTERLRGPVGRALRPVRRLWAATREMPGGAHETHVLWGEDARHSLTVCWAGRSRRNPAIVSFRTRAGGSWTEARGRTTPRPGSSGYLHSVVLDGLEPGARIDYRVSCDSGFSEAFSDVHETRTAPAATTNRFEAVFLCDIGLAGRADGTTSAVPDVVRAVRKIDPLFVLGGGDYAFANRDRRYLDPGDLIGAWFDQMAPVFSRSPFMAQLGNHDVGLDERVDDWLPYLPRVVGSEPQLSRSFDVGAAHFVGLHAPGCAPTARDLEWLADDLSGTRARTASWRIVYQHAPVFAHGSSHPARPELRSLVPLLASLGVDLHLSGHDQSYERTHVVAADGTFTEPTQCEGRSVYSAGHGVLYAKVSPAGKVSDRGYDFSRLRREIPKTIAASHDRAHHWARLQIDEHSLRVLVEGLHGAGEPVKTFDDFSLTRVGSRAGS